MWSEFDRENLSKRASGESIWSYSCAAKPKIKNHQDEVSTVVESLVG